MAKTSDHRHQPAHGGSISAGFRLIVAMWWLPSPRGLLNQNQVHRIPFGRPAARNVNIRPCGGLIRGPTSTIGWSVDGAPSLWWYMAARTISSCLFLTTVDAWFVTILIGNMAPYQWRWGLITSVPKALPLAWNELQSDMIRRYWRDSEMNKIDMFENNKRIRSSS